MRVLSAALAAVALAVAAFAAPATAAVLLTAEQLAHEEVRYSPAARTLVAHLLHRERAGRNVDLRALAERVGAVA